MEIIRDKRKIYEIMNKEMKVSNVDKNNDLKEYMKSSSLNNGYLKRMNEVYNEEIIEEYMRYNNIKFIRYEIKKIREFPILLYI